MKDFDEWWQWQEFFPRNEITSYNACMSAWDNAQKLLLDLPKSIFLNTAYMKRDQEAIEAATKIAIARRTK